MLVFEPLAATSFSFLRGASQPDEMVWAAHGLGLQGLGVADVNTVAGVVRAHVAAKEAGLRLIVGARLVEPCGFETVIYPKDRAAWGRLTRTLTRGNRRSRKGVCTLTIEDVLAAMEGACAILVPPAILTPAWLDQARQRLAQAPPTGDVYVAATRPFDGSDFQRLADLTGLVTATRGHLIATMDALFHHRDRRLLCDVLACIRTKTTLEAAGYLRLQNAEKCLKDPDEIIRLFKGFSHCVANQKKLFDAISFSLDQLAYEYPDEVVAPGESPMDSLIRLSEAGALTRYPDGVPERVRAALDHEYALINELNYAPYFLTVADIVGFARSRGIICQGRGSAANSVVCYCLGITAVDPIRVDLLFERFISAERREPPDIDVDFEHERREEVIQYIYDKFGRHRAGIAGVVISYRGRSALREVGKVMGLSGDTQEALAKSVWGWGRGGVDPALIQRMTGLDITSPLIARTLELARTLHGFPRHLSQHVGGFVITRGALDEVVPIGNAAMPDRTFVEWDKDDLDALGILKIDVLALGMLTCVARAFEFLATDYGIHLGLADIPPDDPEVYDMICAADTIGVFQIESRAQMSMLPRLRPRSFYDLVIEVAIVRPGPIQGDMVHPYLRRRQGLEQVSFPSKALEDVLGKTLGVPLFQEQAMRIAIVAAGFTPSEADRLRRAMATFRKVGIIHEFGKRLVDGMVANGYEREFAERCFRQIEGFGEYGFPESHAASFALIVYVSAWLKKHWPEVFLAAILNAQPMGFYASAQLVRDGKEHGVVVLPPDVGFSDWDNVLEAVAGQSRKAVRLGLREIKGFKEADAARLVAARCAGGPFKDGEDLKRRARLNARAMALLADGDAMGSLNLDRRAALWQARGLAETALPLFAAASEYGPEVDPALPEMALSEQVVHDYARLRLSLKAHPVAFFRTELAAKRFVTSADLKTAPNGGRVDLAGLVLVRQKPGTAKGVLFVTLEDEFGSANVIVWPKIFERFRRETLAAKFMAVRGRLQRDSGVIHVIADRVSNLNPRLAELSEGGLSLPHALARADELQSPREDPKLIAAGDQALAAERASRAFANSRDFH
ncbi:error-prone DNA polymerase [Candidatus Phycosocius bacilliformis]|uniref:Error-prone DNA polymerase n=1 Tax=Candidatus Phycosocius bacilliformis TaxID=1445552 RepID=A0A2P2E8S0_9PROT|nr:error-prone DNA polymerase [Candidatus Phycosocius bacilliformis]GBF57455.1 error-prone DNA polymerase [Candidatus Phycosocius bacilliformis]